MLRIIFAAFALLMLMELGAGEAKSDTGEESIVDIICTQSRLGFTPGEIAEQLNEGDARWNLPRAYLKTAETIVIDGECG